MSTGTAPLTELYPGLWSTPTARLPYQHNILLRSFVLERADGNVIVYASPGIDEAAEAIRELGGVERLLINHAHEAMYGSPRLDVPAYIHVHDRSEAASSLAVAGTFDGRQWIGDDLELIPTPGHTAGTTSFLWDNGDRRFLFTGDFIWTDHGEWKAVVLDRALRGEYLDSLALVRELEFDVLVPWGVTDDSPPCLEVEGQGEIRRRIDVIVDRVRAGGAR